MLAQLGEVFRKISFVVIVVGLLVVIYTEAFADIPVGRSGRPKRPLAEQRRDYCLVTAAGIPGAVWAVVGSSVAMACAMIRALRRHLNAESLRVTSIVGPYGRDR